MMQSLDVNESSLYSSISEEVACVVCFERMLSPKLLKCCHVFCVTCLKRSVKKNGKIKCPTCRKNTKVKNKDPTTLPTAFLVDRINDILLNYERQKTEASTPTDSPKVDRSPLRHVSSHLPISPKFDSKISAISKAKYRFNVSVVPSKNEGNTPPNDGLVKKYRERSSSLDCQPVKSIPEQSLERRHTDPSVSVDGKAPQNSIISEDHETRLEVQHYKAPACPKDRHTYKVKGRKGIYSVNEDIKLDFLKYCHDGVRCNSWEDNIHAILSDRNGRVKDFSKLRVSDGGWLLLCKPVYEGPFTAIVKANEKPITTFDINVLSPFCEPIEV